MVGMSQRDKIQSYNALNAPVSQARFVDASREKLLAKLDISTIGDLLWHAPFRFLDLHRNHTIAQASFGEGAFVGTVHEVKIKRPKPRLNISEVAITDGTGVLLGVWFNQPWVQRSFMVGERVVFAGNVTFAYGLKQINQPFVEKLSQEKQHFEGLLPVHAVTEGISPGWMRRMIASAIDDYASQIDVLPLGIRKKYDFCSITQALRNVHFPRKLSEYRLARERLAYEELLLFELMCARKRYQTTVLSEGKSHKVPETFFESLKAVMPFEPTKDQVRAFQEISEDMQSPHPMNRMLLGDVGTGKTLVAFEALCLACANGYQGAMMAPTEVLAQQYAQKVGPLLDALNISWALLTGSTSAKKRTEILDQLQQGTIGVLFGTHALLEPDVIFNDLSLVIIDEQHRFGVNQRKTLREKGSMPDVLVMSATPIPRTLSATVYGDLATSYLFERPHSNAGFDTHLVKEHQAYKAYEALIKRLRAGEQGYVVCALVDESDEFEAKAANSHAERLKTHELSDFRVGLLTGKMRPAEKEEMMRQFKAHEIDVLVATTVIEVGVDVPNATAMVILDAERFGIAQLHQLRGRVGRGDIRGDVWLVSQALSNEAKERFKALLGTDDGFKLAEFDLKQRGPGDMLGVRQSGLLTFKIADLVEDSELVVAARHDAFEIIEHDFDLKMPQHNFLKEKVEELERARTQWVSAG